MFEACRVSLGITPLGIFNVYIPLKSVVTPSVPPLKYTFAKGMASPEPESVTLPVMVLVWANREFPVKMIQRTNKQGKKNGSFKGK
jgi:hypothetical protein